MTLIKCIQSFGNIEYSNSSTNIIKNEIALDSIVEDKNKSCYIITDNQVPHCSIPSNYDCNSCGSGFAPNHNFHIM